MGRIKTSTNIADAKDCDLIIEVTFRQITFHVGLSLDIYFI